MAADILKETKQRMSKAIDAYRNELATIRAGRANASILNHVNVLYYGVPTPLNQLASITVPEARMLLISPYDKSSLTEIEKAILQSDVGITPSNDGSVIRLVIPALTQERRQELVKQVGKEQENAKIVLRNIRRDAIDQTKKMQKDNELTEDDVKDYEKDIQVIIDEATKELEKVSAEKEAEILGD
ncbi:MULTISPECIES: ribosome recycling factor [Globicatella]|uniref:Ribosome-recycling factor n=2 Tax=Globicatella sulfidifaciens TaxID=136093 RepID=A0A1T4KRU2_9LACT|nr:MULTISPECIES: ribosome recycling factor [Globicatella]MDT2767464.1 ribosome recycling factor [Globicatella sulfidifaciens]NLJ18968.1 ribosome recycling factor [Globicatella sulfidifaciens]WPC08431.1 ribosome recycling factor [Globicatella sp. PHS-GS-PNBC-21-1553]SJZ45152.1 ribosome recycling factor [Globicatella sulfidifaciens DSM 15739]HJF16892.1 ribosome recycling factor [Globicatella sulfidifaciens]